MAAFARTELDLVGLARQDNQAAVQLFVVRDGKLIGRDVFLLDAVREAPDDEVLTGLPRAVLHAGPTSIPQPDPRAGAARRRRLGRARGVPGRAARRTGPPARPAARREARADGARRPQRGRDARPRAGSLAGRPGQDARRAGGAGRRARPARTRRCGSSATTSATSRATSRSAAWSSSRTASRGPASTAASGSRRSRGANDFASHQEVLRRRFRRAKAGEEGSAEELRWRLPDLVIIDGGKGQVSAAAEVLDELGPARPAAGRAGQGARGAVPAGPRRPDPPAGDVAGAVPRPAPARRGAPLRDHLPPRPAGEGVGPLGVRRPAGRRAEAQAGAAARVRLGQARPRRAGRADRGGARASARPWRHGSRRHSRPDRATGRPMG